ncbi:MAG: sensor histidine kinase [Alphaproteobacteria bacterium]|nr:sensor histidine kinase [Alphaproteobacteria bacterium]
MGWKIPNKKAVLQVSALILLFVLLNYLGTAIYFRAGGLTTVKPFGGVALAICLIYGRRTLWPVLITGVIGGMIAKQTFNTTILDTVLVPGLATASLLVIYTIARRLIGHVIEFRAWKQLVGFIAISAAVSAVSAIVFAASGDAIAGAGFFNNWRSWWVPTTLSYVVFTPVIVILFTADLRTMYDNRYRIAGSLALLGTAMAVTFIPTVVPLSFIIPLALLIVTMVSDIEGTALGLMMTQIIYTTVIISGIGPAALRHMPVGYQLHYAQVFQGILIAVLLPVAAAVTERRKLQNREAQINRALRDSEQRYREMAERERSASNAKSEFLAGMSHELRTPLNAILGFSEVIKTELYGPLGHVKYREYAEDVYSSGAHLLELINDVLDLSKIDAGKMELRESVFDIAGLVAESLALVGNRANDLIELRVSLPDDLPRITADKRLIKQILLNLLSNAVKFTPAGGMIRIEAEYRPDDCLSLRVSDNGIGMDQADIITAFSHYGQIDSKIARAHQGTGLGLPISRALAELHGGGLTAQSAKGVGTCVTLQLPNARMVPVEILAAACA